MKKEYEILYGSDNCEPNHKMLIELEELDEQNTIPHLLCTLERMLNMDGKGISFDVCKDDKALTIHIYKATVEMVAEIGDLSDWDFNVEIIKEWLDFTNTIIYDFSI